MNEKKGANLKLAIEIGGFLMAGLALFLQFASTGEEREKELQLVLQDHGERIVTIECVTQISSGCKGR